jgi:hypothetical protein
MWSAVAECREPPSRRSDGPRSPSAELWPLAWPLGKRPPTEGDLNRRSQPGRHPLRRIDLGDDPINMIAIDALKHALLESDPRRLMRVRTIGPKHLGQGWSRIAMRLGSNKTANDGMMQSPYTRREHNTLSHR